MSNSQTRMLKVVHTSTQPLRLEPGEVVHVGVDVHKASYSVALYSDGLPVAGGHRTSLRATVPIRWVCGTLRKGA